MNYIHTLQQRVADLEAERALVEADLMHLKSYLLSPKFRDDSTVQILDVLRRLEEATSKLGQA